MRLRLPHILALMALILAAGVVSVRQFEARRGAVAVPGVVVLDAAWLDPAAAQPLLQTWPELHVFWTAADTEPFSPFDTAWVRLRVDHGAQALLVAQRPGADPAPREPFGIVLDAGADALADARTLADFLVDHGGTLPFVARFTIAPADRPSLDQIVRTLHLAAAQLPSFRRTSIVVLGLREPESGRRLALRLDAGASPREPAPGLHDLIEDTW